MNPSFVKVFAAGCTLVAVIAAVIIVVVVVVVVVLVVVATLHRSIPSFSSYFWGIWEIILQKDMSCHPEPSRILGPNAKYQETEDLT